MDKLVSVIIPVYNAEEYIKKTIESVLAQTFQNIELILVDDGSTDKSKSIIETLVETDSRVYYFYQKNAGAPAARNYGISKSKGDFIYLIDSDDELNTEAIENMLFSFENKEVDLVVGQYQHMNEKGTLGKKEDFGYTDTKLLEVSDNLKELAFVPPFPGNKMYRTNVIKDNNIYFANVKIAQDLNFYLKVLLHVRKIQFVKEVVYYYRFREGSISNTYTKSILDIRPSIENVEKYYKMNENYDKQLFDNIKYLYYSYQLSKVPQIASEKDRKSVFWDLKHELKKIKKRDLYQSIYRKKYWNTTLKLSLSFIFLSKYYQKFQISKKQER
ncbi:glycosyltransferase family 2 protein [Lacticigenium naphthae]|uniref:glycosyltransferase family 2 protein n=1 Tax=Lacticigenium naphthae TaxID=515351 RepID=UPI0004072C6E|nr:glycosyltransferase family 2 protein [Lacticigenium naphthae]